MSPQRKNIFIDRSMGVLLLWIIFVIYVSCLSVFLSVHCRLPDTGWERADLMTLLYVMFNCVFVTFPCGVLGQV